MTESLYYLEYLGNSIELSLGETRVGHLRFIRRSNEILVEDLQRNGAPMRLYDGDAVHDGDRTMFVRKRVLRVRATGTRPVPTTQQHCPNCGSIVLELADECATCRYAWGSYRIARPASPIAKRRDDRLPAALQVRYVSDELELEATSRDLSMTGVFVRSPVLDTIGTACSLTFLGGTQFEVQGVVRRVVMQSEHAGLGVEFSSLGAQDTSRLQALVACLAK